MAEDEAKAASKSSKFLKKSKWGKIFKEDDSGAPHRPAFKLNADVTDFLKPSTEKQVPKLDIAIAQRWPDAHEVRAAAARSESQDGVAEPQFRYTRPRRREGLTVAFAKTPPQIIGEGGEESLEPTSEISRKRIMFSRSISEKTPRMLADGTPWPGTQPTTASARRPPQGGYEEQPAAPQLRRALTSHNEFSPALQAKMSTQTSGSQDYRSRGSNRAAPDSEQRWDHRQHLQDMSAGRPEIVVDSVQDLDEGTSRGDRDGSSRYDDITQDPSFASQAPYARGGVKKQYLGLEAPRGTASPVYRKSRDMSLSEGMAFRRASSMIFRDDEDDSAEQALNLVKPSFEQPPPPLQQPAPPANRIVTNVPSSPRRSITPPSAVSPSGPSPFADPKYIKRHSGDKKLGSSAPPSQARSVQPSRQPEPSPFEDPRYMKNASRGGAQSTGDARRPSEPTNRPKQQLAQGLHPAQNRPDQDFPAQPRAQERSQPPRPPRTDVQQEHVRMAAPPVVSPPGPRGPPPSQQMAHSQRPPHPEGLTTRIHADYNSQNPPSQYRPSPPQGHGQERLAGSHDADPTASRRNMHRPDGSAMPYRQAQAPRPAQNMPPRGFLPQEGSLAPLPNDSRGSSISPDRAGTMGRTNGSSSSFFHINQSSSNPHSRHASQDDIPTQAPSGRSFAQAPPSPGFMNQHINPSPQATSPRSLGPEQYMPSGMSPTSHTSPSGHHSPSRAPAAQASRPSPSAIVTDTPNTPQQSNPRRGSADLRTSPPSHGVLSPIQQQQHGSNESNPAADAAYSNFARRVAHMKGVFRLTAEREQPTERCTPSMWARAALWWFLRGKAGLEILVQQRRAQNGNPPNGGGGNGNGNEQMRELLTQAHVDVAKAWWIVTDPLERYQGTGEIHVGNMDGGPGGEEGLTTGQTVAALNFHLKSISLSMGKTGLMPPTDSLIQGQDTSIWLEYPRFAPDAAAVLGGGVTRAVVVERGQAGTAGRVDPYEMIPLADSRETFCYGRFRVEAYLHTDEADSDRAPIPCMLTIVRGKRDFQTTVLIASQNELVNVRVGPRQGEARGLTWQDVSWKAGAFALIVHLPHGFDLSVRMQERDFRSAWNLIEYARKVDQSVHPGENERMVHAELLSELQYVDPSSSTPFPSDRIRGCRVVIFERFVQHTDGSGTRKMHRGFRLLLITDPGRKTLSNVSHDIGQNAPLFFECMTDTASNGAVAMVFRVREEKRQCRILLVFFDAASRQKTYDTLNGMTVSADEAVIGRMALTSYNIEPATQTEGLTATPHPALQALQWQKLGVTNSISDDPNSRIPPTVESEHLRLVLRHAHGCITDRLNMGKGELLLRLPCVDRPTVQILRQPQEDLSMSVDIRNAAQPVVDGMGALFGSVVGGATIRTLTFASPTDLHGFQACVTGFSVRYDGMASSFGISRRRMVVPIYKKWEASRVRLQVVAREGVVQVLAFMEEFSHADALCFQVKSTDTFENVKGDGKHRKWAVRMVDAKFSLPRHEKGEVEGPERVRRRFANLEGLEYAEEHDDITVGFDTEGERDRFAQALPAATSVARGITLKRRI